MGIFGKKAPSLTIEEKFVGDFDSVVAGMSDKEVEEVAEWIMRYIPIIMAQATSAPQTGAMGRMRDFFASSWKKLVWHINAPLEMGEAIITAVPKHAPHLHAIILRQAQRWREQQQRLRSLEAIHPGQILEGEIVEPGPKLLEPLK